MILYSILVFASCNNSQSNENETTNTQNQELSYPNADTLFINPQKSVTTWIGSKPTGQHDGVIEINQGYIIINEENVVGGSFEVDINSIKVMDLANEESKAKLTKHLLSKDFFDANEYPKGYFKIRKITAYDSSYLSSDKTEFPSKYKPISANLYKVINPNCIVEGELTLRGKMKQVKFPASIDVNNSKVIAEAKFNIDRTQWDIKYGDEASIVDKAKDKFIYNTVNVGLYIEANISQ